MFVLRTTDFVDTLASRHAPWDEGIAIVNIDVSSEGRQKIQKGEMQTKTMK